MGKAMKTGRILTGLILTLSLFSMAPGSASCAVIHVEPDGVDIAGRDGLSWAAAFATINYAVGRAATGDTILVSNGIYNVMSSISISKELTVESLNGADHTILNAGGTDYSCFRGSGGPVTLRGFTVSGFSVHIGAGLSASGEWYIYNCVFRNNSAFIGGAININRNSASPGSNRVYLYDCLLTENTATRDGGAVHLYDYQAQLYAFNTTFSSNTANGTGLNEGGGLAWIMADSSVYLENCISVGNEGNTGGAIGNWSGGTSLIVKNSFFYDNEAYARGGAIFSRSHNQDTLRISNSRFIENKSGGSSDGGAISVQHGGIIENTLFAENHGGRLGGGVHFNSSSGVMRNCTVVYNISNTQRGGVSGGTIINSIIYFNTAPSENNYGALDSATHSIMTPNFAAGTNIITADPELDADFKPVKGSPAINAGLNDEWMTDARDLDRHPRIGEGIVDIGAFEYHPPGTVVNFW